MWLLDLGRARGYRAPLMQIHLGRAWLALVASVLLLGGCSASHDVPAPNTPTHVSETEERIRAVMEKRLDAGDFVGAVVSLQVPGQRAVVVGVGSAERKEGGRPIDPKEPMIIGSVTKTLVAVVALQLMQEGTLQLDQTLDTWFPQVPHARRIRLRDLLQHTSGLEDYLHSDKVLADAKRPWSVEELVRVAVGAGAAGGPRVRFRYSNTNYVLLGAIIERVTGRPWYDEVRARICRPLGMSRTWYAGEPSAPRVGNGYRKEDGEFVLATDTWHATLGGAAGGMISTASDLMRFTVALRDGELLDAQWQREMRRFVAADDIGHVRHRYGLGYERYVVGELTLEGHLGSSAAHASFIGFDTATHAAIAVQVNVRDPGLSAFLAAEVLAELTNKNIGPLPQPSAAISVQFLAPSNLSEPPSPEVEELEVAIITFDTKTAVPVSLDGGDTVITNGLSYRQLRLQYANRRPEAGTLVEAAHRISYDFSWHQHFNENWSLLTLASPGLASELQGDLSFDDLAIEAALVGIYAFNDQFAVGLGAGYNPRLGTQFPMPVLALRWQPMPIMKVEAILPVSATVAVQPHPVIDVGLEGTLEGSSYHGDPDRYGVDNPQLRYSVARAGPTAILNFTRWLHLSLAGGYTFMRRLGFYDGDVERASFDLDNNAYFSVGLAVR